MCICRFEQGTLAIFHDCYMYAEYNDLGTFQARSVLTSTISPISLGLVYLITDFIILISISSLFHIQNTLIWELFKQDQS